MSLIAYIFGTMCTCFATYAVLFWFFAPYNTVGVADFLPDRSVGTFLLAALVIFLNRIWRRLGPSPIATASFSLNKSTFMMIRRLVLITGVISLARVCGPLISHKLPFVGAKLTPDESIVYLLLLAGSETVLRIGSAFVKKLVATADEILAIDHRKPVIYFRSFEKELVKSGFSQNGFRFLYRASFGDDAVGIYLRASAFSHPPSCGAITFNANNRKMRYILGISKARVDEQSMFAIALSNIGPYVALGRPTENCRNMDLGAAKKFVSNEAWKDSVIDWLNRCIAVVVEAADSSSLGWEIEQTIRIVPPTSVLIICPHTDSDYQSFSEAYRHLFPKELPKERPRSRLLTFNENWLPRELTNIDKELTHSLQPFFKQVQQKSGFEEQAQAEMNADRAFEWRLKLMSGELETPNSFNDTRLFVEDRYLESFSSVLGPKSANNRILRCIAWFGALVDTVKMRRQQKRH